MVFQVTSALLDVLRNEAQRAHPAECCGILVGEGDAITSAIPARNVHSQPRRHFEIDPQALVDAHRKARKGGPAIIGYYHSHPNGRPEPSATDRAMGAGDGRIWAIVASGDVTFWTNDKSGFSPLPYAIIDG